MSAEEEYAVREAGKDELPTLVAFMRDHFYPREPILSTYLRRIWDKVGEEERRNIAADLDKKHEIMLREWPCLVAVRRDGRNIAGVCLMMVEENPRLAASNVTDESNANGVKDVVKMKSKILSEWFTYVLDAADGQANLFEKFPTISSALHLIIVCVDPNHARKGLAQHLISGAVAWGRSKKIDLVCGLFTSPYSQRVAEKLGFEKYAEIDWLRFRDADGNLFYEGLEPHTISSMALKLY